MNFKEFLNEVHWSDAYPKSFHEFRKKYGKIARDKNQTLHYYVQFTNHGQDEFNRKGYETPDHSDMVGVYGYPLKYVVEHPSDIWYGRTAKFMRVLKIGNETNHVVLNHMNEWQAKQYLKKMGIDPNLLDYAIKVFKLRTNPNKIGKAFIQALQLKLEQQPTYSETDRKKNFPHFPARSPLEQTELLRKAGIDSIEDKARKDSHASINEREPEQVVFLHPHAFKVVDVYQLREKAEYLNKTQPTNHEERKLAAIIFEKMQDQIVSTEGHRYFSKKGRWVNIDFVLSKSSMNRKIGQKLHKYNKLHDAHETWITLYSEKGTIERRFQTDTKFSEIANSLVSTMQRMPNDPNWKPMTLQSFKDQEKAVQDEYFRKEREKKAAQDAQDTAKIIPVIQQVASKMGLTFHPRPGVNYSNLITIWGRSYYKDGKPAPNVYWSSLASDYEKLAPDFQDNLDYIIYEIGYLPKNPPTDLVELRQIITQLMLKGEFRGQYSFYDFLRKETSD